MGNCCLSIRLSRSLAASPKKMTLLLVGLDNAGKTTIAKRLSEEPLDDVVPTVGFSRVFLEEKDCHVTIYDLGGGPQIRDIWPRYYADVHGVIFVVDAADVLRTTESRKCFEVLIQDSYISGKPILLLANKQDVDGALDEIDIVDRLNVERLVNQHKCPTLVELCSAKHFTRKLDVGISNGYKWLIRSICREYPSLNSRVLNDQATQDELERIRRAQREERLRKNRLEEEGEGREAWTDSKPQKQSPVGRTYQNGTVAMIDVASIPGQVHEAEDVTEPRITSSGSGLRSPLTVSSNPEFFKLDLDDSDCQLLKDLDNKGRFKNFLKRPKSSGPRLNSNRSDGASKRGHRRKLHHKSNKTAPFPMTDASPEPEGPIPKIFDPTYHTEVVPFMEPIEGSVKEDPREDPKIPFAEADGTETNSRSAPGSRKASAKMTVSTRAGTVNLAKIGKLPPLRVERGKLARQEVIIDVTKLDS